MHYDEVGYEFPEHALWPRNPGKFAFHCLFMYICLVLQLVMINNSNVSDFRCMITKLNVLVYSVVASLGCIGLFNTEIRHIDGTIWIWWCECTFDCL
jgi:hypothetical protein